MPGQVTNNEMEMLAVLEGLAAIPPESEVVLVTDSQVVVGWLGQNWEIRSNPKIADLRQAIRMLRDAKKLKVGLKKVEGHKGNPGNERVDALAHQAARRAKDMPVRIGTDEIPFATLVLNVRIKHVGLENFRMIVGAIEKMGGVADGFVYEMGRSEDGGEYVAAKGELKGNQLHRVKDDEI